MKKPKRHVYTLTQPVVALNGERYRLLKLGGAIVRRYPISIYNRREAIQNAGWDLNRSAEIFGQHSELQVQRKDGTYATKNTYPRSSDPRRTKG